MSDSEEARERREIASSLAYAAQASECARAAFKVTAEQFAQAEQALKRRKAELDACVEYEAALVRQACRAVLTAP